VPAPEPPADLLLVASGRHERLWEVLGAHPRPSGGTGFAVWAPHAEAVSVVGDWNGWTAGVDRLRLEPGAGVFLGEVPSAELGHRYKYAVTGATGETSLRADPVAQAQEAGDGRASVVWASTHGWGDAAWMARRATVDPVADRLSAYEVHLGSWRRRADGGLLGYRDLAPRLADHVERLGFTHVELLPVAEHPYDPSWGYQVTGYFAPTSRFGNPDDFRFLVDHLHQRGIGVIVDWVPAHFPRDGWALARFDGTPLYEHTDPQRAEHPDWGTLEFDLTKPAVRGFLVANALYWLGELHVDGLRVDAVASMLYLDYSRGPGEWSPNERGGNEDLDAVSFLQELNAAVHRHVPGALTVAEESTAWDGVTREVERGGLGFTNKWNLGWMHDTLGYWSTPPPERPARHAGLTFGLAYAFAEHFVLPLSHDEVVHLKRPLLGKMPGATDAERFDHLRALYAWMWAHPGKQLLFMGAELAEEREWSQDRELAWERLDEPLPAGVHHLLAELNRAQAEHPALHRGDGTPAGFEWLEVDSADTCTLAFLRRDPGPAGDVVCVANLSDDAVAGHRVGVPAAGPWRLLLSSAEERFGGPLGPDSRRTWEAEPVPCGGQDRSIVIDLPARSVSYLVAGSR